MQAITSSDDLTRALSNALLWCTKTPPWDHALLLVEEKHLSFITSDRYVVTKTICPAEITDIDPTRDYGKLSRDDVLTIVARSKATKGEVRISFDTGEPFIYSDDSDEDLQFVDIFESATEGESFDDRNLRFFGELLEDRLEDEDAHKFMLDPKYFRYISMTRRENPEVCADVWVRGKDPVFIRVGEFSMTVMQPVHREIQSELFGEGVLWT